ncbi:hypothetical protein Bca101_042667 [Brassica carinata]
MEDVMSQSGTQRYWVEMKMMDDFKQNTWKPDNGSKSLHTYVQGLHQDIYERNTKEKKESEPDHFVPMSMKATAEYATAEIAVWWDMKDCPIPEGYDAGRVRASLEAAFEEVGYSGPVSITAYGDQTQIPGHILQGLVSSGISVAHTRSVRPQAAILLHTSEEWCWKSLLYGKPSAPVVVVQGAKLYCKSCNFDSQSLKKFKKHLSSYKHAREESINPTYDKVVPVTDDWGKNYKATPEFATAKIQVWWNMMSCPIPEGYDARRVRPSLEAAFKELGYSGPVSITAYNDHNLTPLQALSSTGVDVFHVVPGFTYMYSDVAEWHDDNPPQAAAILMVITDFVDSMSNGLVRLLQRNNYKLFLSYTHRPSKMSYLLTSAEWLWESLLAAGSKKRTLLLQKCSTASESVEPTATLYCKLCDFGTKSIDNFRTHLSTDEEHAEEEKRLAREESINPTYDKVVPVTDDWGKNYKATPEFATAKIQVWWDMMSCPIPEGYDARRVRPSLEAAFKELGYSGPVSITAYNDHNLTPLQALSSTGVDVFHVVPGFTYMYSDVAEWHDDNPPQAAAILMVITDFVDSMSNGLVRLLQRNNYKLFLSYTHRPSERSYLLTSAEWLWESLLAAGSKKRTLLLQKCSTASESVEPTATLYCKLCDFGTKSIDNFRTHLSTDEEHAEEYLRLYEMIMGVFRLALEKNEQGMMQEVLVHQMASSLAKDSKFVFALADATGS